jgi:hypothetical protein
MPDFKEAGKSKYNRFRKPGDMSFEGEEWKAPVLEIKMKPPAFIEKQHFEKLNGCDVYFPFKPYDC